MLVFTRNVGESFRIGDDVEILVADTNGVALKLGIDAPKYIKVNRKEEYERVSAAPCQSGKGFSPSKFDLKLTLGTHG